MKKALCCFVILSFFLQNIFPPATLAGVGVVSPADSSLSFHSVYVPPVFRGMRINPNDSLDIQFLLDTGESSMGEEELARESLRLTSYFLAGLTIPGEDIWVNLSPYEAGRITSPSLNQTEVGRDLLEQDYVLKRLTASVLSPESETGKKFWDNIYAKIYETYGISDLPVESFHKIWIVPDRAEVFVQGDTVFICHNHLRVMTEEDYLAQQNSGKFDQLGKGSSKSFGMDGRLKQIMIDIILPEIEAEVNQGKAFGQLRQILNSLILAKWFKDQLGDSLLAKVYANQSKLGAIKSPDAAKDIQSIYGRYVKAFEAGTQGVIREDFDSSTQNVVAKKYVTGGMRGDVEVSASRAMLQDTLKAVGQWRVVHPRLHLFKPVLAKGRATISVLKAAVVLLLFTACLFSSSITQAQSLNDPTILVQDTSESFGIIKYSQAHPSFYIQRNVPVGVYSTDMPFDEYMELLANIAHYRLEMAKDSIDGNVLAKTKLRIAALINMVRTYGRSADQAARIVEEEMRRQGIAPEQAVIYLRNSNILSWQDILKNAIHFRQTLSDLGLDLSEEDKDLIVSGLAGPIYKLYQLGLVNMSGPGAEIVLTGLPDNQTYGELSADDPLFNIFAGPETAAESISVFFKEFRLKWSANKGIFYIGRNSLGFIEFFQFFGEQAFTDRDIVKTQMVYHLKWLHEKFVDLERSRDVLPDVTTLTTPALVNRWYESAKIRNLAVSIEAVLRKLESSAREDQKPGLRVPVGFEKNRVSEFQNDLESVENELRARGVHIGLLKYGPVDNAEMASVNNGGIDLNDRYMTISSQGFSPRMALKESFLAGTEAMDVEVGEVVVSQPISDVSVFVNR